MGYGVFGRKLGIAQQNVLKSQLIASNDFNGTWYVFLGSQTGKGAVLLVLKSFGLDLDCN